MFQPEHIVETPGAHEAAEKFNPGATIIEHVANSPIDHPLIHLPTIGGIDFSVTKHVFMLWLVATLVFVVVTLAVRRYIRQDRLVPSGFMNALESVVEFIRDSVVQPSVGDKWTMTWTPLLLTLFAFILTADAIGMVPIFEVLGLLNHWVLHAGEESFLGRVLHGGATVEVLRYMVWPGQALGYKIGELTILELRARAEKELGARFDIRAFHDAILEEGNLPLAMLKSRMAAWLDAQKKRSL